MAIRFSVFSGRNTGIAFKNSTEIINVLKAAGGGDLLHAEQIAGDHFLGALYACAVEIMHGGFSARVAKESAQIGGRAACGGCNFGNADVLVKGIFNKKFVLV